MCFVCNNTLSFYRHIGLWRRRRQRQRCTCSHCVDRSSSNSTNVLDPFVCWSCLYAIVWSLLLSCRSFDEWKIQHTYQRSYRESHFFLSLALFSNCHFHFCYVFCLLSKTVFLPHLFFETFSADTSIKQNLQWRESTSSSFRRNVRQFRHHF